MEHDDAVATAMHDQAVARTRLIMDEHREDLERVASLLAELREGVHATRSHELERLTAGISKRW